MHNLKWLTLIALAVTACNGGDDSDTDTDTGDSDPPTVTLSLDSGTTAYTYKVDGTTVCNSTYSITGEEYENGLCDNCDFMFSVEATETANSDTLDCPNRDPWRYTLSTPYPGNYPDDRAGIAYVSELWYVEGYGEQPIEKMFFSFYHYGESVYAYTIMSGTIYPGEATEETVPGTFTDTDGSITWAYNPDAVASPRGAFIRNCTDREDQADGLYLSGSDTVPGQLIQEPNLYNEDTGTADDWKDYVATADATLTGSFTCDPAEYVESFTVSVAAAATLSVSVDVLTAGNHFDPYIWINDAEGCTRAIADDQFQCTAGTCDDAADTATDPYSCCPSTQLTNSGSSAATYTVYVYSTNPDACLDAGNTGNYSIKIAGGTAFTAVGDNLHPSVEIDASGTGTITETTN